MLRKHRRQVMVGASVLGFALTAPHSGAQSVHWDMQSAFFGSSEPYGTSGVRFADRVRALSGGQLDITVHDPGALVSVSDTIEAVVTGEIEAAWTVPTYHEDRIGSAANFFAAVPFGPDFGEYRAWKKHSNHLREQFYNAYGVTAVDSFCVGPESSGWFQSEIASLEDLRGLKMRLPPGLAASVWQKMGVSTVVLRGTDILPALERGDIDAADFGIPMVDVERGFHRVAKYNYYPGWHQRASCGELLMNKDAYDELPDAYKTLIATAATEQGTETFEQTEARNPEALKRMRDDYGVNILRWPDAFLKRFEAAWREVVEEESAADLRFKRIADAYFDFRTLHRIWGDAQALKSTYLDDPAGSLSLALPLVMAADNTMGQQGFVRIINRSGSAGTVRIHAIDDSGERSGPIHLSLAGNQTQHFNSNDLEDGNAAKGLSNGVGDGAGNWRLELATDLNIKSLAYVRTEDGFLTSIHEVAVETEDGSMRYDVPFFNPGRNINQQSKLRLINPGDGPASVEISARDDQGNEPGNVSLTLEAGAAMTLTARQLEDGDDRIIGSFGAGTGKWQLLVSADRPVEVMSVMLSPTGHITNLSQ